MFALAQRALGENLGTLRFPQLRCATGMDIGVAGTPSRAQRCGERRACVGVIEERVRCRRELDGFRRELNRRCVLAATGERLGAHATPRDRGLEIVTREELALA